MSDGSRPSRPDEGQGTASGPLQLVRAFGPGDQLAQPERIQWHGDALQFTTKEPGLFARLIGKGEKLPQLYLADVARMENCDVVFRARVKTVGAFKRISLWLFVILEERDDQAAIGVGPPAPAESVWATYETKATLGPGVGASQVSLHVGAEGSGTVFVKDVEVLRSPPQG